MSVWYMNSFPEASQIHETSDYLQSLHLSIAKIDAFVLPIKVSKIYNLLWRIAALKNNALGFA